jgi:GT2 family glycosyltransferase
LPDENNMRENALSRKKEPSEDNARGEGRLRSTEDQQTGEGDVLLDQTRAIADLRRELEAANRRFEEASRKLDLLAQEKAEIEAEIEGIRRSTAWRFVTRFRRLKSRLLPPGSYRRRSYDRVIIKFAPPTQANVSRPHEGRPQSFEQLTPAIPLKQSMRPDVPYCSIIVPVRNRSIFTKACLLAVERSVPADKLPYEVIVVDDGSTDDTPALLTSWCLSRVNASLMRMRKNSGFARACNEGARMARGRYIVFLNNDTLPTPGWLEKMLELDAAEPQVGIVGSKLLFPDGRIQHIGVAFDEEKNPGHIYRGYPSDIRPAKVSREYQAVTGACLLVNRELFWSVGGLDESYQNSYEDIDLCLKLRALGCRVLVCADSIIYHFESISENRQAHDFRNRALLKARWGQRVVSDIQHWYEVDHIRMASPKFEPYDTWYPEPEKSLKRLWQKVYSGPLGNEELSTVSSGL